MGVIFILIFVFIINCTVVAAKSDSDVLFCLQSYQRLIINKSLVYKFYPHDRIITQEILIHVS